ncbi:ribonuclease PH, partial [bacterium]|nr:ribonuclease PH [bacterium]
MRQDKRGPGDLRPIKITSKYIKHQPASVLIEAGDTKIICCAVVDEKAPPFLRGTGTGWITAEYSLLPFSTGRRSVRESVRGRIGGRTHEIQRLIGRSLRAAVDLSALGERTIMVDCDVIQADGGTRTTAITGAFVALIHCLRGMKREGMIKYVPAEDFVAAVSAGVVEGKPLLDLTYEEDSGASVDLNIVMTGKGQFVEIQGTGEEATFSEEEFLKLISLSKEGIPRIIKIQKEIIGEL